MDTPQPDPSSVSSDILAKVLLDYPDLRRLVNTSRFLQTLDYVRGICKPKDTVVDVGAWPGVLSTCLARLGMDVIAVDKAPERETTYTQRVLLNERGWKASAPVMSLAELCRREGMRSVHVDIEREPLPFETDSIHAVAFTEVIEHLWHDPLFTMSEINRVLRTGSGVLLLSTPNILSIRNRLNFLLGDIDRVIEHPFVSFLKAKRIGHLGHCRLYAPHELVTMLHLFGFESTVHFATHPDTDDASPVEAKNTGGDQPKPRPTGLARKLFRSPSGYWNAAGATAIQLAEYSVPRFRPQIFVLARKVTDANFDRNFPDELEQLVMNNFSAGGPAAGGGRGAS